jgi:glycogen operon protein
VKLHEPDWGDGSHSIALGAELRGEGLLFHLILNAYWEPLEFELPLLGDAQGPWRRCIDTYLASPEDICDLASAPPLEGRVYRAQPRSVVLLVAKLD